MNHRLVSILVVVLLILFQVSTLALTQMGQLSEYYIDLATSKEGASITSPCKTIPGLGIQRILDQVRGEDGCIFADGPDQHEEFTIDLGKERMLGQVVFINSLATVYGESKRVPNSLKISISNDSANGPWKTIFTRDPADVIDSVALDNVPARWIHFDLGVNKDGIGSRVGKVKVFKRYLLKSGPELMREFQSEFRRDAEGLNDFWKAVDEERWETACDAVIKYYANAHAKPETPGEIAPRVRQWMENTIEDGGCLYKFESADWDWFRKLPNCPHPSMGLLEGGATIFALLSDGYAKTGDGAYIKQLALVLRDWMQDLPCPGVHRGRDGEIVHSWAGLNASIRAAVFSGILGSMFRVDNSLFSRDLKINLLYSMWEHLGFLTQIAPELGGNWLTNVNSNLFNAALPFPEFRLQKSWLEVSKSAFELSLSRDFHPSGKEKEDSMMYMPMATGQLFSQYENIRKAGVSLSEESEQKLSRMFDCAAWMSYPDTSVPAIGDCHRDSPLAKRGAVVPEEYLKIFDRPDLVYINTQGKSGTKPAQTSRAFSDSGWYIMRTAWDTQPYEDARQMFFKSSTTRGHGHPDQHEITMYAYGREIITDPGMPKYDTPPVAQVYPTSAHSTLCVDEKDQSHASGTEKAWVTTPGADFVDCEFDAYKDITHRRQIVFLKPVKGLPDYWLIRDLITGEGKHKLDINFHLSEDANPKVLDGSVITTYPTGGNALLRFVDQSVQPELVDSSIALITTVVPSKTVRYRKEQAPPATFSTIIAPYKGANAPKIDAKPLQLDSPDREEVAAVRVTTASGTDFIVISTKPGAEYSFDKGRIKTDASAVVIRTDKKGKVVYAFQAGGSAMTYKGKPLLAVSSDNKFSEKHFNK